MKKMSKMGKSILLSSLAIIAFGGIAAGTTYALFTSDATTNVSVSTGKVKVDTSLSDDSIQLSSLDSTTDETVALAKDAKTFTNGGSFFYDANTGAITLDKFTPGDKVEFTINAMNSSTVNIKYRTVLKVLSDNGLFQGLKVTVNNEEYDGSTTYSNYESLTANTEFTTKEYKFSIELPKNAGNEYQEKSCQITFNIEAIQGNANVSNPDQTVYEIYTPLDLAVFAKKANANTLTANKVILMNDIDMSGIKYVSPHLTKYIEFDGQNHVIKNFAPIQSKDASNNQFIGLIGKVGTSNGVNVHNITFDKAEVKGDFTVLGDQYLGGAAVVGMIDNGTTGEVKVENIKFTNGIHVSGVKYAGSVVGYTSGTTTTIKSISIEGESTFAGYTAGGIIGQVGGGKATISIIAGKKISVDGYSKEGGIVSAVSGATLDITYKVKDYASTISNEAVKNSGTIVGLCIDDNGYSNTTVNGQQYFNLKNDEELQKLKVDKTKPAVVEIGEGSYKGYSADFKNVTGGVKVVGRGALDKIIWVQAICNTNDTKDDSGAGWNFKGTAAEMDNVTITSHANGYYNGFVNASSLVLNDCKILVDHEHGSMGWWSDKEATFNGCTFEVKNNKPESNLFTYSANKYNFNGCHFISEESSIKLYRDKATTSNTITINVDKDCTFKSTCINTAGSAEYKSVFYLHMDYASSDYNHYEINVAKFDLGKIDEGHNVEGNFAVGKSNTYQKLIGIKKSSDESSYYSDHLTIKVGNNTVNDLGLSARPTGNA